MSKIGQSSRPYDKTVKILLIGNSGVGKSSILLQYSDKKFVHNYYNTIGVDYKIKFLNFKGLTVKLQLWDTAGQDRFKTITSSYYRGADGIIVVYDITDRVSFDNVKAWLEEIDKFVGQKTKKFIIGNKNDLEERRQVSTQQGMAMTNKLGIPFRETSARLATNIESLFEDLLERILFEDNSETMSKQGDKTGTNSMSPDREKKQKEGMNIKEMLQNKKKQESSCCEIY